MLRIPRRFSHFVFGFIQSGLTCAVAAAIASAPFLTAAHPRYPWPPTRPLAWVMIHPRARFPAPAMPNPAHLLTRAARPVRAWPRPASPS